MKLILVSSLSLCVCVLILFFTVTPQQAATRAINDGADDAIVTIDINGQGTVMGAKDKTRWTNQTFMSFCGIPFAESPSGNKRFKAPVERSPWRQIIDATKHGQRCPVITMLPDLPSVGAKADLEDCLNLCVYTKSLTEKRPVMFYIYGGGFYNGSTIDHPPHYLLEKDIVLVVTNYRVGALGWSTLRNSDMPGNVAILDVFMALKWVQNHIEEFGGDPNSITVFSQSAGTTITGSLLLSPKAENKIIKGAIVQSGSILGDWAINKQPQLQAQKICEALKCDVCNKNYAIYDCLKKASVPELLEVTKDESFGPIEEDFLGVLPQNPAVLFLRYNKNIPIMTGFTKHDGSFVLATIYDTLKAVIGNMKLIKVRKFAQTITATANHTSGLTNNLINRFLYDPTILESRDHKKALPAYFDTASDITMKSPVIAFAKKVFLRSTAKTYLYSFDYAGEHTRFGYEFGNSHYPFNGGVHHSNDNIYLFSTHNLNEEDTEFAKQMVELWTSFAIDGVPKLPNGVEMPAMKTESGPYFHINKTVEIGTDVLEELTAAIDDPNNKALDREDIEF